MSLFLYQCRVEILVVFTTIGENENFLRYIPRTVMYDNVIQDYADSTFLQSIKFITLSMCEMVMPNNQSIFQDRK